ncbi:MAG: hypothetical protein RMJ96_08510 [Candidatus Bipolaricaulota bacterium]|nr:hypothetical protein [Candidatus Bipolaricaulota bacterium]MDW8111629.1 hypothetical protein [Candidatus Bipolaricaulota bacterium]MDW8329362.1 hypothetical protein [Candidatus Bipolaricaulota bacterium]
MKTTLIVITVLFGTALMGFSAQAQGLGYYGAQVGGGTIAALAGGVAGTLLGGLTGALLGLPIEIARHPSPLITTYREYRKSEPMEPLTLEESLSVRWAFAGAKVGFGLGVGAGAALGVIWVGKLFGIEGSAQGAWAGAFAGALTGAILMTPGKYRFSLSRWSCKRTEEGDKISLDCRYEGEGSYFSPKILVSPMVLAALGATIGYNARVSFAVSVPLVSASF